MSSRISEDGGPFLNEECSGGVLKRAADLPFSSVEAGNVAGNASRGRYLLQAFYSIRL